MPIDNPDYPAVLEEGVIVKARSKINFIGGTVLAEDNPAEGRVDVTVTGDGDGGDVTGPDSSTDHAIARYDSTTGKILLNSGVTINDANVLEGATELRMPETSDPFGESDKGIIWTDTDGHINVAADGGVVDFHDHAARHVSGGADTIKLDDLTAPDDNTDLDFSTSLHGLTPKGTNTGTDFLRDDGTWATPAGGGDMLIATYDPQAIGADAFDTDQHTDGVTNGVYTLAERTKLGNIATGANLYVHPNHSGEVTSAADGAQTIATSAVTYAKMQNVSATDKVLGRSTAGAGVVEEIACTAAGRDLLDDADAAAQKTTLSLNNVENTAHSTDAHTMTIDGRDVSADGTKLDTIDTNADVTGSNAPQAHEASHQAAGGDILYVPRTYVWFVKGTVAVGTEQGATFRIKRATTVEDVELHVKTAPTGAALVVDINDGGTTIFSTEPEIDIDGTTEDDNHVISDTALAATTELTMDVVQVGSTIAGADLTVLLHCLEAVA